MQLGLVFICFARTITTQFEFVTRAWTTNANFPQPGAGIDTLRAFEHVVAGGYFFVPPLQHSTQPWSWALPS
jgi:deferrochelatase/peroxidase EfeB